MGRATTLGLVCALEAVTKSIDDNSKAWAKGVRPNWPDGTVWTDEDFAEFLDGMVQAQTVLKERDADTRAVSEACSDFGNDEGPRGIRQLYAQFEDRIKAL